MIFMCFIFFSVDKTKHVGVKNRSNRRSGQFSVREPIDTYGGTAVHGILKKEIKNNPPAVAQPPIRRQNNTTRPSRRLVEDHLILENLHNPGQLLKSKAHEGDNSKEKYLRIIDELYEEVNVCKERVFEEQQKRLESERKVKELEKERKLLQDKVEFYKSEAQVIVLSTS